MRSRVAWLALFALPWTQATLAGHGLCVVDALGGDPVELPALNMTAMSDFLPALRFRILTPLYDRVVAWSTDDARLKEAVAALAAPPPGERVLDVGCGTGTLLLALARHAETAVLSGVDADPAILAMAARKARRAGIRLHLQQARAQSLPFPAAAFDVAVSSLVFHHLSPTDKRLALRELHRVLVPGGRLVLADFGRAPSRRGRLAFLIVRLLDGFETTRDHALGGLPNFVAEAGFQAVTRARRFNVPVGSIDVWVAQRPASSRPPAAT